MSAVPVGLPVASPNRTRLSSAGADLASRSPRIVLTLRGVQ